MPAGAEPPYLKQRLAFLRAHTVVGQRVLDVGCGEGHFTAALLRTGRDPIGVEVAEEPLRRGRARWSGLDLRLIPAEARWPLDDASFDVIWAGEVIEHVADTFAWLSETRRVLRPNGTLLLSTPAHELLRRLALSLSVRAFSSHFDPRADHLRFFTARSLRGLLAEVGFSGVEVGGIGGCPGLRHTMLAVARAPS